MKKQFVLLIIFIIFSIMLSGYQRPSYGGKIDYFISKNSISLEDLKVDYRFLVSEPLFRIEKGKVRSNIFAEINYNSKEKRIEFKLGDDIIWNDGTSVTINDVYLSLKNFKSCQKCLYSNDSFQPQIIQDEENQSFMLGIKYETEPDFFLYKYLSQIYLLESTGKRWSGSFYPKKIEKDRIILASNQYSLEGTPFINELRLINSKESRIPSLLVGSNCGTADFYGEVPSSISIEDENFLKFSQNEIYGAIISDDIPENIRSEIYKIFLTSDFIQGITKNKGIEIDTFPTMPIEIESEKTSANKTEEDLVSPIKEILKKKSPALKTPLFIVYADTPVLLKLAKRVEALLVSEGYQIKKNQIKAYNPYGEQKANSITLFSLPINNASEALVIENVSSLLAIINIENRYDIMDGTDINKKRFKEAEAELKKAYRLFYFFILPLYRIYSCNICNGIDFSKVWLIDNIK